MKKRQKPVLMVTILAVLVTTVVGFNILQNPDKSSTNPQTPPEQNDEKMLDAPRASGDAKQAANDAASKMAGGPNAAPTRPGMPKGAMPPGMPKPSLLRPSPTISKPKPNDSATTAQWYSSEHAQTPSKG